MDKCIDYKNEKKCSMANTLSANFLQENGSPVCFYLVASFCIFFTCYLKISFLLH